MPRLLIHCLLVGLLLSTGCGRVVFRPSGTPTGQPQPVTLNYDQQQQIAQREQDLQRRAEQMDRDNQELESLLAQSRQQVQLLGDQVTATQQQLRATADQLASTQSDNSDLRNRTEKLLASTQQTRTIGFAPNSSLLEPIQLRGLTGVDIRQDGDVIRVALPADQIFYSDSAQLQPTGERLAASVATQLMEAYPGHMIGIEGHTDGAPVASAQYPTPLHLSVAQATAIYDALRRTGVPAAQLFTVGQGANHPLVSNATEAGRQKNRRLEMVVYPETLRRR
ncbi:putative lipoprotein YiaD precursor [Botrimarina colliarenosi]|uniref:Putative lipoprotein YiaD n=1 Tax=Botrimarina colliarenosi TaxID=2528001 RepID=A0A5C6AJ14_9BACT|nr:OmpA family protein [Botrimarina colliarenosi]TWT99619.1 putative lipoprotein YiaD precursor [Botrimarina colliarenosi]